MKISDEVYVHGYVDEIRKDVVIVRNEGGYFGTVPSEVIDIVRCKECRWASPNGKYGCMLKPFSKNDWQYHHLFSDDFCSYGERREP